jgi:hypothetical protein
VSPEEEAQIRAEDKRIYIAAALDHPWLQAKSMARNAFGQLILFSIHEYLIPSRVDYTATDMTLHMPEQAPWQTYVSIGEYLVVIGSLGFICVMWRRDKLSQPVKQLTVMVIATVVIEALVGAISEPAPRYEARVIWLIPMAAGLIWAASRRTDHVRDTVFRFFTGYRNRSDWQSPRGANWDGGPGQSTWMLACSSSKTRRC